ncbi:MAG: septum formation initiator family protein [Clostridiales bacterium]|jgi:cell division protein FtsL|nr:septum formation initiator family protein [Eubacteriales bacterium]MDH7567109.1 septum formation initiator family protein [Clostridiales bacterium]
MHKRKKSKLGMIALIGVLAYFFYIMVGQQKLIYEKTVELNNIQEKIAEENRQNQELKKQKEMVNSDEYIEKIAREKLDMVKHGERVFVDVNK